MPVGDLGLYFRGYLNLLVIGDKPAGFLNLALGEGLHLHNLRWLTPDSITLDADLADFRRLRRMARVAGCRLRIKRKYGFPFLVHRIRRRKMLLWGALFFLAALYFLGSFIWSLEVVSHSPLVQVSRERILDTARQAGLQPGIHRSEVELRQVEELIIRDLPQLSWVGIEVKGTSALINVREKNPPGREGPPGEGADLIAAEDGVVEEILVMQGRPEVKVGDTVRRGQVLISGLLERPLSRPQASGQTPLDESSSQTEQVQVKARGIVRATVWYQFFGDSPIQEEKLEPTGRSARLVNIRLGRRELRIYGPSGGSPFIMHTEKITSYFPPWRNLRLPVELKTTTYQELVRSTQTHGRNEARLKAEEKAMDQVMARLPAGARIIQQRLEEAPAVAEGRTVSLRVKLWLEVLQDIAVASPSYPGPSAVR